MTALSATQCNEIDKAIRELDPLSKVEGAARSASKYDGLRDKIIDELESDTNKFYLTLAVSDKIDEMGVPENSVNLDSFIKKVGKIAGLPGA